VKQLPHYYIPEKDVRKNPKCKDETDQILVDDYASHDQRTKLKFSENCEYSNHIIEPIIDIDPNFRKDGSYYQEDVDY
jgi:hypothetical protein